MKSKKIKKQLTDTINRMRSSMSFNIIGTMVLALVTLAGIVGFVGFASFSNSLRNEYAVSTYHMADTAVSLINGDHLDAYLAGEETEEYEHTKRILNRYVHKMNVTMLYVIKVNPSDYSDFVSIFNSINNTVDDTHYEEWELGHYRKTTNEEYRLKYLVLYENDVPYETVYRLHPTDGNDPHITTIVPVKNSVGHVEALLCMQRPFRELQKAMLPYIIKVGIATILLNLTACLFVSSFMKNQFVYPVRKISREATRFARENIKGEPLAGVSRFKEISNLAASIDTMESDMMTYMNNLTAVTAERERIRSELSLASAIQENSLPNTFPAFPDRSDFDIYASMTPAKGVGGDFYNFFLLDDDHLLLVMGDVSGKGIPGALFMMVSNIILTDGAKMGSTPAEILSFTNTNICEHNRADMFVTLWVGILELSTGKIVFANAGHEDAAVCRKDGEFELYKTKHGIPVGAIEGMQYRNFELQLYPGDKLFLYTDGVPEATDRDNNMFTLTRMIESLNSCKDGSPKEILQEISRSVKEFTGDAPAFDDLTMLGLVYRGPEG